MGLGTMIAVSVGGQIFLTGSAIQSVDYRNEKRRKLARARMATSTYYVVRQPAPEPVVEPTPEPVAEEPIEESPPPPPPPEDEGAGQY